MLKIKHFTFNPLQENTYVIYNDEGACAIIDPGCYFQNERKELTQFITKEGLLPKCLLNTHCHPDHTFGNKFVAHTYGLQLHIHPKDKPVFDRGPEFGIKWGLPYENYDGELVYLNENEEIDIGGEVLDILFTPGHSPGSVSFYHVKQKLLFSGDVLFREGIGRTDLPGGDFDTLINSIASTLFALPGETVVHPGHSEKTTIGYEKQHNPFLRQAGL